MGTGIAISVRRLNRLQCMHAINLPIPQHPQQRSSSKESRTSFIYAYSGRRCHNGRGRTKQTSFVIYLATFSRTDAVTLCCIPNTAVNIPLFRAHRCNRQSPAWQKTKVLAARVRKNKLYLLYYGGIASPPVIVHVRKVYNYFCISYFFYTMNYYH